MKKNIALSVLLFVILGLKSQEQRDSVLTPKINCVENDEEIEVFITKGEMFGLYVELTKIHFISLQPDSLWNNWRKEKLIKWLPSDTGRALIAKLLPKGKDTVLFSHNCSRIMVNDSTWFTMRPWTHTQLKRKQRKEEDKKVMVLLNGNELLALFDLIAFNEDYYRARLFRVIRHNYCNYASYPELVEWVRYYQSNYSDSKYFLKL